MAGHITSTTRPFRRLAQPLSKLRPHYDAIVIGSGYGAAIAASRLSRSSTSTGSKLRVCVLERGDELQPGEYPDSPKSAAAEMQIDFPDKHVGKAGGMYDFRMNDELNAFVGCGLGGGSLVNANVALEPNERILSDPVWPSTFRSDVSGELRRGFSRAREMLKPVPYPSEGPQPKKLNQLQRMGHELGATTYQPPINVHFGAAAENHVGVFQLPCTGCGDCVSGCNQAAKNTLLMNYLPDAVNHGADIFTRIQVRAIEKQSATGKWAVWYRTRDSGEEKFGATESFLTADKVFLGAGALGSTEILLRSRERGLALSTRVGQSFTGNGDVLAFAYNGPDSVHPVGFGDRPPSDNRNVGPCITSVIDLREAGNVEHGLVIEDGSFPSPLAAMLPLTMAAAAATGAVPAGSQIGLQKQARETVSALLGAQQGAVDNTQVLLVMSHDSTKGTLSLEDDRIRIHWPGLSEEAVFEKVHGHLRKAAEAVDATLVRNPAWTEWMGRRLITVHPLGGCGMGDSGSTGAVDHAGRVFKNDTGSEVHAGLYVCDGAVIPRSLGVNPLLTISAIAERTVSLVAKQEQWSIDYSLGGARTTAPSVSAPAAMGIEFTERMRGFVGKGGKGHKSAAKEGRDLEQRCEFTLTVVTEDLEGMLNDPLHRASLTGTVKCAALSTTALAVSRGEFQLLPLDPNAPNTRKLRYSMTLMASNGKEYRFKGFKQVSDEIGPDVWADTTTLFIDVSSDEDENLLQGVLVIEPHDFAVEMATFRVLRAPTPEQALHAKLKFGKFFAGALADTYSGLAIVPKVWPNTGTREENVRARRPLRLPTPESYFCTTQDNATLRLTRFNAGAKGPVILSHGLGVSSRIFTVDTIDTNLAEYLAAKNYDVWLLDYRASIDLPSARASFSGDEIAKFDYPAAVALVKKITNRRDVQVVAHCFGASTFFMALTAGLTGVRSAVFSQIGGHVIAPRLNVIRAGIYMPDALKLFGIQALTTDVSKQPNILEKAYDKVLSFNQPCPNTACHRINFMYAPLYEHSQLNNQTHESMGELFGVANVRAFQHLAGMIRHKRIVAFDGADIYLSKDPSRLSENLKGLNFPIRFIHGALNKCFLPESTEESMRVLKKMHPATHYDRVEVAQYGHIDCIFGKNAAADVYPFITEHLDKTASN